MGLLCFTWDKLVLQSLQRKHVSTAIPFLENFLVVQFSFHTRAANAQSQDDALPICNEIIVKMLALGQQSVHSTNLRKTRCYDIELKQYKEVKPKEH